MHFDPSLFGKTLAVLRVLRGWTQKQLAAACQLKSSAISELEHSPDALTLAQLQRFSAAMDQPSFLLNVVLWLVRLHRRLMGTAAGGERPAPGLATEAERIGEILDRFHQGGEGVQLAALAELKTELREREGRRLAAELWEVLEPLRPAERRLLVKAKLFQKPALVELLCQKSIDLAAHDAGLAVAAAELALELAGKVAGDEKARWRLQGYAGFHFGNALRVRNEPKEARTAIQKADFFWERAQPGESTLLEARVLGIKAALLAVEQRFAESEDALDKALTLPPDQERPSLLLIRGRLFAQMNNHMFALASFQEAEHLLADQADNSRLLWVAQFNQVCSLLELDRLAEAMPILSLMRQSSKPTDGSLDLLRLQWLEARVAKKLAQYQEAVDILSQVREEFRRRNLLIDEGFAVCELEALRLEMANHSTLAG
jgi:transcriptional regulator with XRE-family HTH domain